jgi:hypothetical protein
MESSSFSNACTDQLEKFCKEEGALVWDPIKTVEVVVGPTEAEQKPNMRANRAHCSLQPSKAEQKQSQNQVSAQIEILSSSNAEQQRKWSQWTQKTHQWLLSSQPKKEMKIVRT